MEFYRRYSLGIGLFLLAGLIVLLLSSPGLIFSKGVSFIDTELTRSSGNETFVRTKMDFGSGEHMKAFPKEIQDWTGYDYDTTELEKAFGADVVLLRAYDEPGLYQPLFFLIIQSKTESSFHPPTTCYPALGYGIQEEGKEKISVTDTSWLEEGASSAYKSVLVKKLVVAKESGGEVIDRRVVLYYYVKGNRFTTDTITMVRVEALAPVDGSYDGILGVEKDFTAQTIPYMFEPGKEDTGKTLVAQLAGWGVGGYFAILLLLSIPVAVMVYPRIIRAQGSHEEPQK